MEFKESMNLTDLKFEKEIEFILENQANWLVTQRIEKFYKTYNIVKEAMVKKPRTQVNYAFGYKTDALGNNLLYGAWYRYNTIYNWNNDEQEEK